MSLNGGLKRPFPFTRATLSGCISRKSKKNPDGLSLKELGEIAMHLGLSKGGNKKNLCLRIISHLETTMQQKSEHHDQGVTSDTPPDKSEGNQSTGSMESAETTEDEKVNDEKSEVGSEDEDEDEDESQQSDIIQEILDPVTETLVRVCHLHPNDIVAEVRDRVGSCLKFPQKMCKKYQRQLVHYTKFQTFDKTKTLRGKSMGSGTYGEVYALQDQPEVVAKAFYDNRESELESSTIREVGALRVLSGLPGLVNVLHMDFQKDDKTIVYIERWPGTLTIGSDSKYSEKEVRSIAHQLLEAVAIMHNRNITHNDIKPANILWNSETGEVALADFGLSRFSVIDGTRSVPIPRYVSPIPISRPSEVLVQTIWYRAPEVLLGGSYDYKVDLWSVGVIIAELVLGSRLLPGDSEIDELFKIMKIFGTPNEESWPGVKSYPEYSDKFPKWSPQSLGKVVKGLTPDLEDLLGKILRLDPNQRISVYEALEHPYFTKHGFHPDEEAIELSPLARVQTTDLFCIAPNYLQNQPKIKQRMRAILVDWLFEVSASRTFKLELRTLMLALTFLDLYLQDNVIKTANLQLVGIAALYLAANVHEEEYRPLGDFRYITDNTYRNQEILDMSTKILESIYHNVYIPTEWSYLRTLIDLHNPDKEVIQTAIYLLYLASLTTESRGSPEILARTLLAMAEQNTPLGDSRKKVKPDSKASKKLAKVIIEQQQLLESEKIDLMFYKERIFKETFERFKTNGIQSLP